MVDGALSHHLNGFVVTLANRFSKHMGESCRFAHFFCIETEHRLVNVPFKVSLGNKVVRAEDDTLEVSPKALNAVG